jgi:prepilin-type N-terminal cleavage/methylation domain-containing protein
MLASTLFSKKMHSSRKGFTLIELMLVIAIIATLSISVFVALNPVKRFADARDSRRVTDVETILTAIHQYIVDNKGALPTGLTTNMAEVQLGTSASGCTISTGGCNSAAAACVNLNTPLAKYISAIPLDPTSGTAAKTGYDVIVDSNNIVTVKACGGENSTISIAR